MTKARWVLLPALLAAAPLPTVALSLKLVSVVPSGPNSDKAHFCGVPTGDTDRDSLLEVCHWTGTAYSHTDPLRWELCEYRPVNRWELVHADTGGYPYPPYPVTGNLTPWAIGDADRDGRPDIVGTMGHFRDSVRTILQAALVESPGPGSHPSHLTWLSPDTWRYYPLDFAAITDLDQDGNNEVFGVVAGAWMYLWESRGDDSFVSIPVPQVRWPFTVAFGDFDGDGLMEYATGFSFMHFLENTAVGQDSYELVCVDSVDETNSNSTIAGDVDGDGTPEVFAIYYNYPYGYYRLLGWDAVGNNSYQRCTVDTRVYYGEDHSCHSDCGDLDGDGKDEVVWVTPGEARVYQARPGGFDWVWSAGLSPSYALRARVADANRNGYGEVLLTRPEVRQIHCYEVEAVRLLSPNGGNSLVVGDTCRISWRLFTPPRCDSVSLFLLTDTVVRSGEWFWRTDTIVTGLAPADTGYDWVVPDTTLAAAWIVAMAYGPGWQYDRSDAPFAVVPTALAEPSPTPGRAPALPTLVGTRLHLSDDGPRALHDALGRRVQVLVPGDNDLGRLPPGVYFLRRDDAVYACPHRLVIAR